MPQKPHSKNNATKVLRPLAEVMQRQHHRRWLILWGCVALFTGICIADHAGFFVYPGDVVRQFDGRWFAVDRIVDGDTLDIKTADGSKTIRLRLWGIDTPEIANASKGTGDQPFALEALAWTSEHCKGKQVRIGLQPQRVWGRYGRLLCYVYLEDGLMLNEQLLLHGLAKTDRRFGSGGYSKQKQDNNKTTQNK